jgi:hypothetical protein
MCDSSCRSARLTHAELPIGTRHATLRQGSIALVNREGEWVRYSFDGEVTTRSAAREQAKAWVDAQVVAWAAQSATPTRIPLQCSGSLGFLVTRRWCRLVRQAARDRGLATRHDRRLSPRWVELIPPPSRTM